jgi:hypothetical protein
MLLVPPSRSSSKFRFDPNPTRAPGVLSDARRSFLKGGRMDEKNINKFIVYAVMAIIASSILQMIVPFLFWAVIGMVAWRVYQSYNKYK